MATNDQLLVDPSQAPGSYFLTGSQDVMNTTPDPAPGGAQGWPMPNIGDDLVDAVGKIPAGGGANVATVTPVTRSVNPATETVQGRIAGMLTEGSPLFDRVRSQSLAASNSRGLLNSSIAEGAAQGALLDAAGNIATQDANIVNKQEALNQQYANQAEQLNADAKNKVGLGIIDAIKQAYGTAIEGQYKQILQASQSAQSFYTSMAKEITNILNNKDTSPDYKAAALSQQKSLLQAGLALFGSLANRDFGSLLQWEPGPAPNNAGTPSWYETPPAWYQQGGQEPWIYGQS